MTKGKNNPAYRTNEQIVTDVTIILKTPVTYGTKKVVCRQAASAWTQHSGKYEGCVLWSKEAFEQYRVTSKVKGLRHEHAVPKKVVVDELLGLQEPSESEVSLLFLFLIGVVVTREEEKRLNKRFKSSMPREFYDGNSPSLLDVLLRYKKCGIEVGKVEWQACRPGGCNVPATQWRAIDLQRPLP
jgi:hypothetical protein